MKANAILLLNLAILVANFALSYGSSETQIRVMRTTARAAYAPPAAPTPPRARSPVPDARLFKYLAKLPEAGRLTQAQVATLCGCLDYCCETIAKEARKLRSRRFDVAHAASLRARLREDLNQTLSAAAIGPELRAQLVSIVLSSTG